MKRKLTIPEGTRDFFQEDTYVQRQVITDILKEFSAWGYDEVKTPMIEKWNIVRKNIRMKLNFHLGR